MVEKEKPVSKVEEAQKIIEEENNKKLQAFSAEYKTLCEKYGLEIKAVTQLNLVPLQRQH